MTYNSSKLAYDFVGRYTLGWVLNVSSAVFLTISRPSVSTFEFINDHNYGFLHQLRNRVYIPDFGAFDLSAQRMQYFIYGIGKKRLPILFFLNWENITRLLSFSGPEKLSLAKQVFHFSRMCKHPVILIPRYRPGTLTNWSVNFQHLYFFVKKKFTGGFNSTRVGNLDRVLKKEDDERPKPVFFPSVLVSLNAFDHLHLFAEAERLQLPILGPCSFILNNYFWTYTTLISGYSRLNIMYFFNFFAAHYLEGSLAWLVFQLR